MSWNASHPALREDIWKNMKVPFRKWLFWMLLCSVTIGLLNFLWHLLKKQRMYMVKPVNPITITSASITPLNDNRTFVLSAYYDNREKNNIRVLAIVHQEVKELYCWFYCSRQDGFVQVDKATIDFHSDNFGFAYGATDLLCPVPRNCDLEYLSINWSAEGNRYQLPRFEIKNRKREKFSANFTVCISTLYGDLNNVLQFIQTMEMYKLLGAQKVMIYKLCGNCCCEAIEEVLQYYEDEGTLEIIPWPIDRYFHVSKNWRYFKSDATNIGYFGQIPTLNDCLYRNMYTSRFVLLNDIDELILPFYHKDWYSMMVSLQQQNPQVAVFRFENRIFPNTVQDPIENGSSWNTTPGVNSLQCVYQEPMGQNQINYKMIVNPRKVIQTSVHNVLKAYGAIHEVSSDIAIMRHCRKPGQPNPTKQSLVRDTTIWRFKEPLTENVDKVISTIHNLRKDKGRDTSHSW